MDTAGFIGIILSTIGIISGLLVILFNTEEKRKLAAKCVLGSAAAVLAVCIPLYACSAPKRDKPPKSPNPSAAEHYDKGMALYEGKFYEEAVKRFTDAIRLEPSYKDAHYYRALSYECLENYSAAVQDFTYIIDNIDCEHWASVFFRAYNLNQLERYEEAMADWDRAANNSPGPDVYRDRGFARYKLGYYLDALFDYSIAMNMTESYKNDPDFQMECNMIAAKVSANKELLAVLNTMGFDLD